MLVAIVRAAGGDGELVREGGVGHLVRGDVEGPGHASGDGFFCESGLLENELFFFAKVVYIEQQTTKILLFNVYLRNTLTHTSHDS